MNGVIQKGDASAQYAAKNFGDDQTKRGGHRPAKNGGAQRGTSMAGMIMSVELASMAVFVIVSGPTHALHSTYSRKTAQPSEALIRQFDTALAEWIDALASGCDHETSFLFHVRWRGKSLFTGDLRSRR